jgi:predicted DNA-binding transcriptional regulator AlpA
MATLLRTPEVAELLGVSSTKLEHMRGLDCGPNWIRIGRQVRYRLEDINAYLDANTNRTREE